MKTQTESIRRMFDRIAPRYDLLNRVMSLGFDRYWRREVIQLANLPAGGLLLDAATGTGDLAREAARWVPGARVTGIDFSAVMLRLAALTPFPVRWALADAVRLPFADGTFDAVVSGFLLRNVPDSGRALHEQFRVLKPGGRVVCLDTSPPSGPLAPFQRAYMGRVIPILGRILAGEDAAYRYLPRSTERFLSAEKLAARMREAGFGRVGFRRKMFGAAAIHWGTKP